MKFANTIATILTAASVVTHWHGVAADTCETLLWSDEFDGSALNESIWNYQIGDGCDLGVCGWGNNEGEWYTDSNVQVSNGTLQIIARAESSNGKDYTSARITTLGKADFDMTQNVRVECRAKVPAGMGLWPAIWMLPSEPALNTWPLGGEIDLMEFIGREPYNAHSYLHYGQAYNDKGQRGGPRQLVTPVSDDFHVFGMEKTGNQFRFSVDGIVFQSYTSDDIEMKFTWPFESTFYFIMNLAVGGNWPGYPDATTTFPATLEVDYLRVYELDYDNTYPGTVTGPTLVRPGATAEYCIEELGSSVAYSSITSSLPEGASVGSDISGITSGCVDISFGDSSGYLAVEATGPCGTHLYSIPVEVQPFYGKEFGFVGPDNSTDQATFSDATGDYEVVTDDDDGTYIKYQRNIEEVYDSITFTTDAISDPDDYKSGDKKFYMDVRTTTSAPCTWVLIQLEDDTSTPDNYPTGRYGRFIAFLEDTRDWQRVEFDFYDHVLYDVTSVSKIVVLFDSFMERGDTYYIRNFDSDVPNCTSDDGSCEPLWSGVCRKRAKSEAGACGDGVNNDRYGYDGDAPGDCDDADCWTDPVCTGEEGPAPTRAPSADSTTGMPLGESLSTPSPSMLDATPTTKSPETSGTASNSPAPSQDGTPDEVYMGTSGPVAAPSSGSSSKPPEICNDGIDNDGNGFVDCNDVACGSSQTCGAWFEPTCAANGGCSGELGNCCPDPFGEYKECCDESPASCSVNEQCASLGLEGLCCPTVDGVYLDCCQPEKCAVNPKCSGLAGPDCCPTPDGVFLDCCEEKPGDCKLHPQCGPDGLGLAGSCCPTSTGDQLDCCEPAECSEHPACLDLGLVETCCPTQDGIYLDCCFLDLPNFNGSTIVWESSEERVNSMNGSDARTAPGAIKLVAGAAATLLLAVPIFLLA